ncbi:MAG: sugar phosphate isomerase/epimerase [Defluviitaleaceae bacterium]|nr:sugar phosphate isomerase/epimerase [Defluviitaleaceae bacterium]
MIKLGVNTVLFKKYSFAEAAAAIKKAGFDGLEISALGGMCEHLRLDDWRSQKDEIKAVMEETGLAMLSTEVASQDRERLLKAFEAGAEIGIPVINIGPGGKMDDEDSLKQSIEAVQKLCELAEPFGVTLCVKAHVGNAVYSTPTTLKMMAGVTSPAFGVDMDPSHIWRAGERPEEALPQVLSKVKHIHIRDCKGMGPGPGEPALQACGRGDIDLFGYCKAMADGNYDGPCCLEVIGPDLDMTDAAIIAAETYGYLNACLKKLGAR